VFADYGTDYFVSLRPRAKGRTHLVRAPACPGTTMVLRPLEAYAVHEGYED
jgi:hypothetical protein